MFTYCSSIFVRRVIITADNLPEEKSSHSSDSSDEIIDIKGDQFDDKKDEIEALSLSSKDMWALGLTTAIAGHFFPWNAGLGAGFGSYLIATILISTAFFCLILSISELSSALPFAGGAYGIARVTLGIFPGYLVACCDTYKSVLYVSTAAFAVGEEITRITNGPKDYEAIYWLLFYFISILIQSWGGKFMWRLNFAFAALCSGILLVYILGSIQFADFEKNSQLDDQTSNGDEYFSGGVREFMSILPLPCWFFVGVQSINLACGQLKFPKRDVPRGTIAAVCTVMVTSLAVLFVTCSLPPSVAYFKEKSRPLTTGFSLMFGASRDISTIFSVPATIASGFGFMYYYSQQLFAMGRSGLLNKWLGKEWPSRKTPVVALVAGALFGYGMCRIRFYLPDSRAQFHNISMLGAFATYLSIFASFIIFRLYYPTIKREFISPLGIAGAVYGFIVFSLAFVSVCGFQKDQIAIVVFGCILVVCSVYYYLVVKDRQIFSEEEKTVLFKAYLVKNNKARNQRIKKGAATRQSAVNKVVSGGCAVGLGDESNNFLKHQTPNKNGSSPGAVRAKSKYSLLEGGEGADREAPPSNSDRTKRYNDGNVASKDINSNSSQMLTTAGATMFGEVTATVTAVTTSAEDNKSDSEDLKNGNGGVDPFQNMEMVPTGKLTPEV